MNMFWKKVTKEERTQEFCGVEGMPYVTNAEPGQFTQYVPTPIDRVKDSGKISIFELTRAKRNKGMYPIQKALAYILKRDGSNN